MEPNNLFIIIRKCTGTIIEERTEIFPSDNKDPGCRKVGKLATFFVDLYVTGGHFENITGSIVVWLRVCVDLVINLRMVNFECHILVHWCPKGCDDSHISHPPVSSAEFSGPEITPLMVKLDLTVSAYLIPKCRIRNISPNFVLQTPSDVNFAVQS